MRSTIIPILIAVVSWLISTSAVLALALTYVWSRHDGHRRRAHEMVCLLLRRDQPPVVGRRHVPIGRPRPPTRRRGRRMTFDPARDGGRSLRRERASMEGRLDKNRRRR
jgi:hypothetical protein